MTRDRGALLRRAGLLLGDATLLLTSLLLAYWLRYDGHGLPAAHARGAYTIAALDLVAKLIIFGALGLYALSVPQMGIEDVGAIARAVTAGIVAFWGGILAVNGVTGWQVSPDVMLIDAVLTLCTITGSRLALHVWSTRRDRVRREGVTALIVGAGAAGEQLASSLRSTPGSGYVPIGFLDDDAAKHGTVIHGLRVMGSLRDLAQCSRTLHVEAVLIAMPSAPSHAVRRAVSLAHEAGVREIRIIPSLERILKGEINFTDLQQVQLDDLLGRQVVTIDTAMVETWLRGRRVLVTGAAGSIGSELCRQIAAFHPGEIIPLDYDETGLFWIERDLRRLGQTVVPVIEDVRDAQRMRELLRELRPDVVFHAAAYKHVGLMEQHPLQAVRTNVLGTLAVGDAAQEAGVEKVVLISTDKAVNPTSVMGASKRTAEQVCLALNGTGKTRYVVVRFGNVLGSRGSVVPLFQDQIRRGEPLTVRGANTQRYFMMTSEAVLLVLQAGAMGRGGEVFVLDMGAPIRVLDLARELIRLSGLRPDTDVPIIVADPQPGEKELEDLLTAEDGTVVTQHQRVFVARRTPLADPEELLSNVASFEATIKASDVRGVIRGMQSLVPTYRPSMLALAQVEGPDAALVGSASAAGDVAP